MASKFGDWQSFLDESLEEYSGKNDLSFLVKPRSTENIIKYVRTESMISEEWIQEYFLRCSTLKSEQKSTLKSKQLRTEGNEHFRKKGYKNALETYTQCILCAPVSDEEQNLALGFANRSAVFYHLQQYQACLDDISHALESDYPSGLQYKLYQRRGQCLYFINKHQHAAKAFSIAMDLVEKSSLTAEKKLVIVKELMSWVRKMKDGESANSELHKDGERGVVEKEEEEPAEIPRVLQGYNDLVVQATSAVTLTFDVTKGRHLVANQKIREGDTLIVEQPYAGVLLPTHYYTHCHHCFGKLRTPIPCRQCALVRYCSAECSHQSWVVYHSVECPYMDLFHSIGIAHLALRIILTAGRQYLLSSQHKHQDSDRQQEVIGGLDEAGKYNCSYDAVFALMPHLDNILADDLYQYSLTAALLLQSLEEADFFREEVNSGEVDACDVSHSSEESKVFFGGLLLRHICQLICNAHAITELQMSTTADSSLVESQSQMRVATAIYPTASLMNHSCDPTIISRDTLIVRATKDVEVGGEIFNCYGPHCKRMSRSERQQSLLEQYFFKCECEACDKDIQSEAVYQACKCPECEGPLSYPQPIMTCQECGYETDGVREMQITLEAHDLFLEGLNLLKDEKREDALKMLRKCCKLRDDVLYKYNKERAQVHDALARCLCAKGIFSEAADHLIQSVETTEIIYGEKSIELANELQKYAEVLFHAKRKKESVIAVDRAIKIFQLNYGGSHEVLIELKQLKKLLK